MGNIVKDFWGLLSFIIYLGPRLQDVVDTHANQSKQSKEEGGKESQSIVTYILLRGMWAERDRGKEFNTERPARVTTRVSRSEIEKPYSKKDNLFILYLYYVYLLYYKHSNSK